MRVQQQPVNRGNRGFTLVEALVTMLIVVMVSVIVATGVPAAVSAYHRAVASANAQTALATVTSALRDELGTSTKVWVSSSGDVQKYLCYGQSFDGNDYQYEAKIENGSSYNHRGPVKTVVDTSTALTGDKQWTLVPDADLVTTQDQHLQVVFDGPITFEDNVFKVNNLRVYDDDNPDYPLATVGEGADNYFAIRAPYCTVQRT